MFVPTFVSTTEAPARELLDLSLAVVGAEVEVDRAGQWPRLLAALKENAGDLVRRARYGSR